MHLRIICHYFTKQESGPEQGRFLGKLNTNPLEMIRIGGIVQHAEGHQRGQQ